LITVEIWNQSLPELLKNCQPFKFSFWHVDLLVLTCFFSSKTITSCTLICVLVSIC
jgi:hypothetical protein